MTSQNGKSKAVGAGDPDRHEEVQAIPVYLKRLDVSEDDLIRFNSWLQSTALTWKLTEVALETLPKRGHADELVRLRHLGKCATTVLAQFDLFEQLRPLDQTLRDAYQTLGVSSAGPIDREWARYRARVNADMAVLLKVVKIARDTLAGRGAKRGTPTKGARDATFMDLLERLEHLTGQRTDLPLGLAVQAWNDCFAARPAKEMGQAERDKTAKSRGELSLEAADSMIKRRRRRASAAEQK